MLARRCLVLALVGCAAFAHACGSFGLAGSDEKIGGPGTTPDGSTSSSNDSAVTGDDAASDGSSIVADAGKDALSESGSADAGFKCSGTEWLCDEFERQMLGGGPWSEPGNTNNGNGAIVSVPTPLGRGVEAAVSSTQGHGFLRDTGKLGATGKRAIKIATRYAVAASTLTDTDRTMLVAFYLRISGTEIARAIFQVNPAGGAEIEVGCSGCPTQKLPIPNALAGGYRDLLITMTLTGNASAGIAYSLGSGGAGTASFTYPSISADPDVELRVGADHENRSGTLKATYENFAVTVSAPL